jgi:predicted NBD/HSP70 family sugar kinase
MSGASGASILAALGHGGPLTRTELAARLGLSPATVTQVTRRLIAEGMLEELDSVPSGGGRPARPLGLVGDAGWAIGVKIAPGRAVAADVRLDGEPLEEREIPLDTSAPHCLDTVAALLAALASRGPRLLGVGITLPGIVDSPGSGVVESPALGWAGRAVGAYLRGRLELPVLVDNDVNALAVAELLYGIGRRYRDLLVVTIGRGVGLAIVSAGVLQRGSSGGAGEFGHLPMADGPRCACGNLGCLEAVLRARPPRHAGVVLGRAVAGLVNVLDPAAVLILGEGTRRWELWRPGFEEGFAAHLFRRHRHIPVQTDPWDDSRWARGAAALVLGATFGAVPGAGAEGERVRARLR